MSIIIDDDALYNNTEISTAANTKIQDTHKSLCTLYFDLT